MNKNFVDCLFRSIVRSSLSINLCAIDCLHHVDCHLCSHPFGGATTNKQFAICDTISRYEHRCETQYRRLLTHSRAFRTAASLSSSSLCTRRRSLASSSSSSLSSSSLLLSLDGAFAPPLKNLPSAMSSSAACCGVRVACLK